MGAESLLLYLLASARTDYGDEHAGAASNLVFGPHSSTFLKMIMGLCENIELRNLRTYYHLLRAAPNMGEEALLRSIPP